MRRYFRLFTTISATAILSQGCHAPTGPATSWLVEIGEIDAPTVTHISDTVRISFSYEASCGPRTLAVLQDAERVEISVRATPYGGLCLAALRFQRAQVVLFPYQRAASVTAIFRQPGGVDSVRTITSTYAAAVAP